MHDDLEIIRLRQSDLADILDAPRRRQESPGVGIFQVFDNGSMPTGALKYYATHPVDVSGVESEGTAGVFTVGTAVVMVDIIDGTPAVGDRVIGEYIGGRWVAELGTGTGGDHPPVHIPGCACDPIPNPLHLSWSGPCTGLGSATITYGPTPYGLSGFLGANCFLSDEIFTDSLGAEYRLRLSCGDGFFSLGRVYLPTDSSDAFVDANFYQWSIGSHGSTCSPFLLTGVNLASGTGVDPACIGTITG